MKIPDDVRGDAPMRLAIHHRMGMFHDIALISAVVCFATSTMGGARPEEEDEAPPSSKRPGLEPDGKCGACGMQNEDDAKFCDQCGKSMAARPSPREPGKEASAQPPKRVAAIGPDAAYAELAGVPSGSSVPVIKGAMAGLTHLSRHVLAAFDLSDPERALAAFDDCFQLAARVPQMEAKLKEQEERAKLELGRKIVALKIDGYPRGDVLQDIVNDDGKRVGVRLAREYRDMSLARMDEKYRRLAARNPQRKATPFEPDEQTSRAAGSAGGASRASRIEAAKKSPTALRMLNDPNRPASRSLDDIARALVDNEDSAAPAAGGGR